MIQNYVPRKVGLDAVIRDILSSSTPLKTLAEKHMFFPIDLLESVSHRFDTVGEMIEKHGAGANSGVTNLPVVPRIALQHVAQGQEYIGSGEEVLRQAFPFGEQEYYFLDVAGNLYNSSFTLALFPQETSSVGGKRDMLKSYTYPPRFNPEKYEHIKTLIFTAGSAYLMIVVKGEERVDLTYVAEMLHMSKKHLRMAPTDEVSRLTGREVGAVSPLLYEPCFKNIQAVYFSRNLLEGGYSKPHYELVLDRRSALVVSDLRDVLGILKRIPHYPEDFQFVNEGSHVNSK